MEGSQIKTKILIFLSIFAFSFLVADDTNDTLGIEDNSTMELIKAYVDDEIVSGDGKVMKKMPNPTKDDYLACQEQNSNSFIDLFGIDAIVIDKHHAITFSRPEEYQVYDPFYDFYVLYSQEPLPYTTQANDLNCSVNFDLAAINFSSLKFGKFSKATKSEDVNSLNFDAKKGSMITTPCCEMVGISLGGKKYLTNDYLNSIAKRKQPFNGYIGATFKDDMRGVYVSNLDPFSKELLFCPEDEIVSVNGIKIKSKQQLQRMILSERLGNTLDVVVKRGKETHTVNPVVRAKPSYSLSAFTYLETLGIKFGKDLSIKEIADDSFAQKSGLKEGDRLLQINFKKIKNLLEARDTILYSQDDDFHLLFTRNDFQFFIKFNRKDVKGGLIAIPYCPAI